MHGGKIWAESQVGRALRFLSRFRFALSYKSMWKQISSCFLRLFDPLPAIADQRLGIIRNYRDATVGIIHHYKDDCEVAILTIAEKSLHDRFGKKPRTWRGFSRFHFVLISYTRESSDNPRLKAF
jgi:hypothetical protein